MTPARGFLFRLPTVGYSHAVDRRKFVDTLFWSTLAGAALSSLAPIPFFLRPPAGALGTRRGALGQAAKLAPGQAVKADIGRCIAIAINDGNLKVFNAACTHQDCPVDWNGDTRKFVCHCHGAEFDSDGRPVKGPAKEPLVRLEHRVERGEIVVE